MVLQGNTTTCSNECVQRLICNIHVQTPISPVLAQLLVLLLRSASGSTYMFIWGGVLLWVQAQVMHFNAYFE